MKRLLIACLLAKDPDDRPETAEVLAEELQALVFQLRDTEGLVRESLQGLDCQVYGSGSHYRIVFELAGGRRQEVHIEIGDGRFNQRLVSIYSVCCPADPDHYEFALRLNAELTIGGLSIRVVNGEPMFVMTRTYARGQVTPADVRAAVLEIALRGDSVEQQLTREDVF